MKVIDRVRAHYDKGTGDGRAFIDVPEWGEEGEPLRIYWTPLTVREARAARRKDGSEADFPALVATKAQDAAGKPMFPDIEDAHILATAADAAVVNRIAIAMATTSGSEEMRKNSKAIPSS